MVNFQLPRIDKDRKLQELLRPYCRLKMGEIWSDPLGRHKVACIDASDANSVKTLMGNEKAVLAIQDPPYNLVAFDVMSIDEFIAFCKRWVDNTGNALKDDSSLYVWLGADQKNHFQPFAEFILMMRNTGFSSKSFISMRNQRGYGTQKNWMALRQELLYYVKGKPFFNVKAAYTNIPKVLRGYYKVIDGKVTENLERSKSKFIRAGNIWIDIQQVFYRMEENVNGCYAQKPLKAIERIILSASRMNDLVIDLFSHAGTTVLACEIHDRRCFSSDIDPVYCEITIRRLELYRDSKKTGWQNSNPFADEVLKDKKLRGHLIKNYNMEIKKNSIIEFYK
ncbi:MAG: site-specific DNA-methyltransferase [Bacteroidota bacterium]|nr:site-specific DNA-methyltransferase [Bacteroidota bacterium]